MREVFVRTTRELTSSGIRYGSTPALMTCTQRRFLPASRMPFEEKPTTASASPTTFAASAGTDHLDVELPHPFERPNPRGRIGMAHVVERAIDAGVAGAEDLVFGQISAGIAGRVGVAEEEELDALLAVVEDELVVEDDV